MNILIPDTWLREYLKTKATPKQIKEYLSLCGPSIERIRTENGETIYDIEVTSNRPDAMSVVGIAREAAAILPVFNIVAKFVNDPYNVKLKTPALPAGRKNSKLKTNKTLTIRSNLMLNPRWTSIVLENVTVKSSPDWLQKKLEATGIRSLNNIIDITNYLMRAYGQPAHVFDFDSISDRPNYATMTLRASKKGERLVTLDGKSHTLPGDDIVIEDGKGRLIDLCGVMGAHNSAIKETTKTVILFLQTYDPMHIRRTMMNLAHRTEAGGLFEKGIDPELVLPAFAKGVELITELSGGRVASKLYDIYPKPYKPYTVVLARTKADTYIGKHLTDKKIIQILTPLGFQVKVTTDFINVLVPSFRRDVTIDVDIIEELARIYGYHNITPTLPDTAPPVVIPDPILTWEEEIKVRLRDWGYTETYTYSMISEELMDIFGLDKSKAYKISNPLSNEWGYMRPSLLPSMLTAVKENLNNRNDLKLFELSMAYHYRAKNLPIEQPTLVIAMAGERFYELKGLAESLLRLVGISLTELSFVKQQASTFPENGIRYCAPSKVLSLREYGYIGGIDETLLTELNIKIPVTILELNVAKLVADAKPQKIYTPIPKFPPSFEDFTFVVEPKTPVGSLIEALKSVDPLIVEVSLLDIYEDTRTFHITYLSREKNLIADDIRPIHEKIIYVAKNEFGAIIRSV